MKSSSDPPGSLLGNRWVQLLAGIAAMVAVTNLQYGWTFFVGPILEKYPGWDKASLQIAFTVFVLTETWLVPLEAYLADRYGRRLLVGIGGVLAAVAWVINSRADSLWLFYLGNCLGGAGAGVVYGVSMGSALQWFPDRRGLAAGLTAAAFGAGSALTVMPLTQTIDTAGYEQAFFWFGLGQGLIVFLVALLLRPPPELAGNTNNRPSLGLLSPLPRFGGDGPVASGISSLQGTPPDSNPSPPKRAREAFGADSNRIMQTSRDFTPGEMLRTPPFWLLYAMMTLAPVGGLMAIAQLKPMAESYGVAAAPFVLFGLTVTAVQLAAQVDRVLNGLTRPLFGSISDRLGRENTMFIAFALEGAAILLLLQFAHVPSLFVIFSGLTFFAWGEIYTLFPALCADMFGRKFAATNYGLLYTSKGTASLLVPLGSHLFDQTGSWAPAFTMAVAFDWVVALAALLVLKPLRMRQAPEGRSE